MNTKLRTAAELEAVLGCGTYQVFMFVMYQFCVVLQCSNMVFMSFGKVAPSNWYCRAANQSIVSILEDGNATNGSVLSEHEKCELVANGSCERFDWETDFYSIVPQWHLICDRTGIVYLIMSVQMLGVLIGSPIYGQLSDAYGRKWTLFFAHLSLVLLDGLSVLSPNWQVFLVFRFLIGLACGGTITITWVLMTEMLKAKHRLWVTTIAGWPPSFGIFAGLAYATGDWKRLSLAITAVGIPPLLMLPWAAESPRWQIQKQKMEEAGRSLKRVMKWNKEKEIAQARLAHVIDSFQEFDHPLRPQSDHSRRRRYTYWHLCQTRKMTKDLVVLISAYISINMITYGIVLNNDKLTGDKYLNLLLFACIRWISSVLTPVADASLKCCGRKLTSAIPFSVVCLCSTAVALIMVTDTGNPIAGKAITGLVLVASMMASPIWSSLNLTAVEAFPTPIRNIAVGVTGAFTRLGGVIVPVFLYMAEGWAPSPFVLFAVVGFLSALLCGFLLPETKGKPMPDKMPDRERHWWPWCCGGCTKNRGRPEGTTRSNSFTVYHFTSTRTT